MNYFDVLEIPVSYKIDEQTVTRIYLEKQRMFHPDANVTLDPFTTTESVATSKIALAYVSEDIESGSSVTLVNEAYTVIMNPILRAEYFLKLKGIDPNAITASENAVEMLNISEQYESMDSDIEKERFFVHLNERMSKLLDFLYKSEDDIMEFSRNFTLLRFIKSFLEKVAPNAYSGN